MRKSVYLETSVASYLAARPSRDVLVRVCQQVTADWWSVARPAYDLYVSALVLVEAAAGDADAAARRAALLDGIPELMIDDEARRLAARLLSEGAIPPAAEADALHIAVAAVQGVDFLLTWNCRHIDNAERKPLVRSICTAAGYRCPEICTPWELLPEDPDAAS